MKIELSKINHSKTDLSFDVYFEEGYNKDIKGLESTYVNGYIYRDYEDQITLEVEINGKLLIEDSHTLETVPFTFATTIKEKINETDPNFAEYFEKNQNTLDIMPIIWQNIVLEVPIAYSSQSDDNLIKSGQGWELVEEEKPKIDPRLAPLAKLLDDEKEWKTCYH